MNSAVVPHYCELTKFSVSYVITRAYSWLLLSSETYWFAGAETAQKATGWSKCICAPTNRSSNRPSAEGEEKYSSLVS